MNEAVTKRFLLYFRLMMLVWILIANAFFHVIEFDYSWLVLWRATSRTASFPWSWAAL